MNSETLLEIQSIEAIFPNEVQLESARTVSARFGPHAVLCLQLPSDYPSSPPALELCAPSVDGKDKKRLLDALRTICSEKRNEPILYSLIEKAMEFFAERKMEIGEEKDKNGEENSENSDEECDETVGLAAFYSGLIIEDRKSKFQAHVAKLTSKDQVPVLVAQLKSVGRIARARHNPFAWRIVISDQSTNRQIEQHDCEDDGECGASSKILRLMVHMKAEGLIVVTRWYGGRHLGPDRFKHICNAAREALISGGFVTDQQKR